MSDASAASPTTRPRRRIRWGVVLTCAALLAAFATLSYLAVRSKSPTYDEPLHAVGAWMHLHHHDFRINPEDPPLWHYWAALPNGPRAIKADTNSPIYRDAGKDIWRQWPWVVETLYPCGRTLPAGSDQCPDSDLFVLRSRRMMLALGVLLGAVIAWWGWQLGGVGGGGGVAAIVATALYAFDPNFLGHAALVKNDVPLTLIATGLFLAVWRAGRKLTAWNALAIALLCAAAVTTKFSGLIFGPIVAILILLRAITGDAWQTTWRPLERRSQKLIAAVTLLLLCAFVSWGGIWAAYFFRFGPSPDPSVYMDIQDMGKYASIAELTVKNGVPPTDAEAETHPPSLMTRTVYRLYDLRLFPQAWLYGLLYTYQSAVARDTYLLGQFSKFGWWYYFPVAMLVKTPLATLAAAGLSVGVLVAAIRRAGAKALLLNWTAACLIIPPAFYLIAAMRSNLNLGLRHVLPVYPFIFLGIALAAAYAWRNWRSAARWATIVLTLGLATETLLAFPNYIAFFNAAAGGSRGGFYLLGDSNLDWGQDLKLLAQWQQGHPDTNLYLVYFGLADPWAYGIKYINFPGGYRFGPVVERRSDPGVLAVSATHLQAVYQSDYYRALREEEPIEVLGGTIYLYRWPVIRGK